MTTPADSPFAPKGEPRFDSGQSCGYKPSGAPEDCGKPATWHVMWDRDPHDNSLTCDEHMTLIQQRWVYDDRHPVVADCTMPGALWSYPEKRCEFPTDEPALTVARQINGTP
ncbi:hypothetical protein OG292_19175 [Streptomyces sp. NBC_01511]|uniref:hypothetical protein n=1 Tax=Streptomyces sp. NBC_01511 TaxID=2903889 RepID=UPI00386D3094